MPRPHREAGRLRAEPPPPGRPGSSPIAWHALDPAQAVARLDTDVEHGLDGAEADRRRAHAGSNTLRTTDDPPAWRVALRQFRSLVVLLLLAAAVLALALGETIEAMAILAALVLNAAIGFGTEWRAQVSLARLRALTVPGTIVRRDGRVQDVAAATLVPGDVIVLAAGARVPADARLARSTHLALAEAELTGESAPVDKDVNAVVIASTPLAERRTMVYQGTSVVAGTGIGVVTETGDRTELGRIGQLVRQAGERATPLERQVEILGRRLILLALAVCAFVGLIGILHGEPVSLMVETAISLAVAAIPEGLPAIVAIALATGMWRLARAGALVRRLPAVETLGATTVICADKTGTMTQNRMTVCRLALAGRTIVVKADPGATGFVENGATIDPLADVHVARLLTAAALANDASVEETREGFRVHGDPTEAALLLAARAAGLDPGSLRPRWPRLRERPFSSDTRLMATFNATPEGGWAWLVKGAPATVLAHSTARQVGAGVEPLAESGREQLLAENRRLAAEGLRVLAVACRFVTDGADERIDDLTFLGFVAIEDPVRPGVAEAIARCRQAGIETIMLTGDQRVTAEAVGRQLGIEPHAIRSRASPEDKLRMIRELQTRGEVVAMTGDGVNDAPALVRADIGVAMGRRGTDVARDAADVATIVRAIEEGRVIYANLRKVIHFLFSCNLTEIVVIFAAIVAGLPAPLLPLQILWVNLVTDILPAIALIRDPAEPDVMRRAPREPGEALVTWRFGGRVLTEAALLAAGVLSAYLYTVARYGVGPVANTVAFLALVLVHPLQAMHCRSARAMVWRLPPNRLAVISLVTLTLIQAATVSWSPLAALLGTVPISPADWAVLAVAVLWPVIVLETLKACRHAGVARNRGDRGHAAS